MDRSFNAVTRSRKDRKTWVGDEIESCINRTALYYRMPFQQVRNFFVRDILEEFRGLLMITHDCLNEGISRRLELRKKNFG